MLPLVIKLSGKALAAENELLTLFKALQEAHRPFILVHGGGVEVDRLMTDLTWIFHTNLKNPGRLQY